VNLGRVDRSFTIRPGSPGFTLIEPGSVPQGSERVSEISRERQRRDTERRHYEEPLRAETAIKLARADYQQCRWCADTDGSVDRQCGCFQVTRYTLRKKAHAAQVQERERHPVQWLNRHKGGHPCRLGHYRPPHDPGRSGEHRGMSRADAIEQGAADKQKDDDLGSDRYRPQHPNRAGTDPGCLPADHGEAIVHRVAAQDQSRYNNDPAIEWEPQQRS
jgi:hypothetical protein